MTIIRKNIDDIAIIFAFILGVILIIFNMPMVGQGYLLKTQHKAADLIQVDCVKIEQKLNVCIKSTKTAI